MQGNIQILLMVLAFWPHETIKNASFCLVFLFIYINLVIFQELLLGKEIYQTEN